LLIVGEPRRSLLNSTFYLKMALLAGCHHADCRPAKVRFRRRRFLGQGSRRSSRPRFTATASIAVWCGILFAGRWIAYTQQDDAAAARDFISYFENERIGGQHSRKRCAVIRSLNR